jgi:nucleoside 2-deoxyribosyltransferase
MSEELTTWERGYLRKQLEPELRTAQKKLKYAQRRHAQEPEKIDAATVQMWKTHVALLETLLNKL